MNSGVIFLDLKKAFETVDDMLSRLKKNCLTMDCRVKPLISSGLT